MTNFNKILQLRLPLLFVRWSLGLHTALRKVHPGRCASAIRKVLVRFITEQWPLVQADGQTMQPRPICNRGALHFGESMAACPPGA